MNHEAIYALYPNVVSVDDGAGAFDKDSNKVDVDIDAVNSWIDPNAYKHLRKAAYPSIPDQLDLLYHGGMDEWKAALAAVKSRYPK